MQINLYTERQKMLSKKMYCIEIQKSQHIQEQKHFLVWLDFSLHMEYLRDMKLEKFEEIRSEIKLQHTILAMWSQ